MPHSGYSQMQLLPFPSRENSVRIMKFDINLCLSFDMIFPHLHNCIHYTGGSPKPQRAFPPNGKDFLRPAFPYSAILPSRAQ